MTAVYQKELKSYFNNLFGYIYIALVLLFMGFCATNYHFKNYYVSNMAYSLQDMAFILLLITPLLTMRIIAEERQKKTDTLLYSLPVSVTSTVLGKYFAMLTVYIIPIAVISIYPLVLSRFGEFNFASAYSAILGLFFMGASLLAIGMFISSLTENQFVACIVTMAILLAFVGVSMLETSVSSTFLRTVMSWFSLITRYTNFSFGIFDIPAIIYYISLSFVFLFSTVRVLEKRRWN